MHRRLQQAQYLLLNSRMPLAALAQEVGFADASSFSRAFKNHFSETPSAARRSMQAPR
jgi:transcriptional regulator GlxA family with amidase domain